MRQESASFLDLNYHPETQELVPSPACSLWLGSSMDVSGTEEMGQTLSILHMGGVWKTCLHQGGSVDPGLEVRLAK